MEKPTDPTNSNWNILKLLNWTTAYFESHNIESPRASAEVLLAHVLGLNRIDLYIRFDQPLAKDELERFKALIKRRRRHEPVAYIVGSRGFWSLDLKVKRDVLIPRPETETLVAAVLEHLPQADPEAPDFKPLRILDLGTGSGAIILSLAAERAGHLFFASDISPEALRVAYENAGCLGFLPAVLFWAGNLFDALHEERTKFDIIVSNPPYIKQDLISGLQPEIADFEPRCALDGGPDGLQALRQILDAAHRYLKTGGRLFLEIGWDQRRDIEATLSGSGLYRLEQVIPDFQGHDRVVHIIKK